MQPLVTTPMNPHEAIQRRLERVEQLISASQQCADPALRSHVEEVVQGLLEYHRAALEQILILLGRTAPETLSALTNDDLVASVLLLYDLHPASLPKRVEQALEEVRPFLRSHGGEVELLGIDEGIVRLEMRGSCHGCPSSMITLKTRIEQAIEQKAPDAVRIEVEGLTDGAEATPAGFVSLDRLTSVGGKADGVLVNGKH